MWAKAQIKWSRKPIASFNVGRCNYKSDRKSLLLDYLLSKLYLNECFINADLFSIASENFFDKSIQ